VAAECNGHPQICELLTLLAAQHQNRCKEAGITAPDAVVNAMAVGLVEQVWRNGPVEDIHSSRRGPSDAGMFAESTDLQVQAVHALTSAHRAQGLITFEHHLLDRDRRWAGTGGRNLRDLGYGHLGDYARQVRKSTNAMLGLAADHTCVDNPLEVYLVHSALTTGLDHKGMPRWPVIVDRIEKLLENSDHPAWRDDTRGAEAVAQMPPEIESIDRLKATLLDRPSRLSDEVLAWLSKYFLYCAAPPYDSSWGIAEE
jgi:hypothetical protein